MFSYGVKIATLKSKLPKIKHCYQIYVLRK